MNNGFKYAFFASVVGLMVSGCNHRGANPYDVKTQNNAVYADMPINRHIQVEPDYDEITQILDEDANEQIEKIIGW